MRCFLRQSKCRVRFRRFWCLFLAELFNKPWEEHTAILENVACSIHLLLTTTVLFFRDQSVAEGLCLSARFCSSEEVQLNILNMKALQSSRSKLSAHSLWRCCVVRKNSTRHKSKSTNRKETTETFWLLGGKNYAVPLPLPLYSGFETH